jgi:hypothetical protein
MMIHGRHLVADVALAIVLLCIPFPSTQKSSAAESTADAIFQSSTRQPHNEIERKYRDSMNGHLKALKNVIPSFGEDGDIEDLTSGSKPSKGAILIGAVVHIKRQRKDILQIEQENALLKRQVGALQALVTCEDCSLMEYVRASLENIPPGQA